MYLRGIFSSFINMERLFHLNAKPSKCPLIEVKLCEKLTAASLEGNKKESSSIFWSFFSITNIITSF